MHDAAIVILAIAAALSGPLTAFVVLRYLPVRSESREFALEAQRQAAEELVMRQERARVEAKLADIQAQRAQLHLDVETKRMTDLLPGPNRITNPFA